MTTYTTPKGAQIIICDGCGLDPDGKRHDRSRLTPVDQSAELRKRLARMGLDDESLKGCGLTIRDTCPSCMAKGEGARID